MAENPGHLVLDQGARAIGEDDIVLDPSPVTPVAPPRMLIAMPEGSPTGQLLVDLIIHLVEGVFGSTGTIVVGPTPDNGIEGRDQGSLRVAPVGADLILELE